MNLFPKVKRPYLVYTPSYTYKSSGVRTLHLLVHLLNEAGETAYLVPDDANGFAANPALNTPLLTAQHQNFYMAEGIDPIAVYPDIVRGNPMGIKHVVRYLLAPAGAFGGSSVFPYTDQIWGALPSIADNVLRIPVSDPGIFYSEGIKGSYAREGSCFYSHKYDKIHGQELLSLTENSKRLEGSLEDIAKILRDSQVCYLYEVSSILTEAALCDCPVLLVRTPYFNTIDLTCMMGETKWSDGEIVKKCDDYWVNYMDLVKDTPRQLHNFIIKTQGLI